MTQNDVTTNVPVNTKKTVYRLFALLEPQKVRLSFVLISLVLYTAFNIWTPIYSAKVIDLLAKAINQAIASGGGFQLHWANGGRELFYLSIQWLLTGVFYYLQSYLMADVAETLTFSLRQSVSQKLNQLPMKFFDQNKSGVILSKLTNDLDKVSETLQTGLLKLLSAIGTVTGSLLVMLYYNITLSLVFIIFAVISLYLTKIVSQKNFVYAAARQETLGNLTARVEEYYSGRNIIKSFNQEEMTIEKVAKETEENRKATTLADFYTNCMNPLTRLVTRLGETVIALLLLAGTFLISGTMSIGTVIAFFQYVSQSIEPLTQTSFMINSLQAALASAERVFEILDEEPEKAEPSHIGQLEQIKGNVVFEQVSFGYSPEKILMKNISFQAKAGQKIAIVGTTGAGKTTLINLLMRFYEINSGSILIDGQDSNGVSKNSLRKQFGMVLQDTWIFEGTVAENIAYGKPQASREEIKAAAKAAKIHHFIKTLPNGYDTVLENGGGSLSIGQRQLLTIARVFLVDPPMLILDEATSSVDTRTEVEISKAMSQLMSNRTSFVIAHRLSTIRDADLILYMEQGNIIEQGNHQALLKEKGAYANLYYSQFS